MSCSCRTVYGPSRWPPAGEATLQMLADIAHIRPDVLDQMRAEGWFRAGPVPELGTSEPELGTSARTPEPEEWR